MNFPKSPGIYLLLSVFACLGCKARDQNSAALKDVQPGSATSDGESLMNDSEIRGRHVVLVYYANDTYAPTMDDPATANQQHIVESLKAGVADSRFDVKQKTLLANRAKRYEYDWNDFRKVVDQDVRRLTKAICTPNARFPMSLIVFRNFGNDNSAASDGEYERELSYSYCLDGERASVGQMTVPRIDAFPYGSQPFSHPVVFTKALGEVEKLFPSGAYRYILITKSHGSKEMAIAPFFSRDVRSMSQTAIAEEALKSLVPSGTSLDGKEDQVILDGKEDQVILDANKEDQVILDSFQDGQGEPIGVSKRAYLQSLLKLGGANPRLGMYFPLVFMEACKSDLRFSRDEALASALVTDGASYVGLGIKNIGLLYTADERGLAYRTIDFEKLFTGFEYNKYDDFQDALRAYLDAVARRPKQQ